MPGDQRNDPSDAPDPDLRFRMVMVPGRQFVIQEIEGSVPAAEVGLYGTGEKKLFFARNFKSSFGILSFQEIAFVQGRYILGPPQGSPPGRPAPEMPTCSREQRAVPRNGCSYLLNCGKP